jgi:hypothetical protein
MITAAPDVLQTQIRCIVSRRRFSGLILDIATFPSLLFRRLLTIRASLTFHPSLTMSTPLTFCPSLSFRAIARNLAFPGHEPSPSPV